MTSEVALSKQYSQGEQDHDSSATARPMDLHVSAAVVTRIKQNKFEKITDLLNSQDQEMALNVAPGGNILLTKVNKNVKIASFDQWISGFLVFASIYCEQFSDQAQGLFRYISFIQDLSNTYGLDAALKYDEDFRRLKERSPLDLCIWDTLNQELYLLAAARAVQMGNNHGKKRQTFRAQRGRYPPMQCPRGYCYSYAFAGNL